MQGQINRDSFLGRFIYDYVSESNDGICIIDIGTWNGLGTTKCIIDAIIDSKKEKINFLSIEANHQQFLIAQKNLANYVSYVNLIYGRLTELSDIVSLNDYDDKFFKIYSKELQSEWMKTTIVEHETAPNISTLIPSHIDILVLDGGEYSTHGEFIKLVDRTELIILDDITTIKNFKSAEHLRASDKHKIIFDVPDDRYGFLVAKKI
jgi:hypothetical protein